MGCPHEAKPHRWKVREWLPLARDGGTEAMAKWSRVSFWGERTWLHDSVNTLKNAELYILNGQIVW